ncbi:MAG: sulfite exporter TauE/SafE family protein [Planctomycetota bacterium]|nr:MAG: sulfite exporter TauE/SafE family protein [Planctomycetota bacterium]
MLDYLHSFQLSTLDWVLVVLGALFVGMSKGGLPGISGLAVWMYVKVFGAKESVGMLVSVLICADLFGVVIYRRHADLAFVKRMLPFLISGTLVGTLVFVLLPGAFYQHFIGAILLLLVFFHFGTKRLHPEPPEPPDPQPAERSKLVERTVGVCSGSFSMLANAGSVLLVAYLIRLGLPKLVFLGTFASLILISNVVCLPLHWAIGSVTLNDLPLSFALGLLSLVGVVAARLLVAVIPQKLFEAFIWTVVVLAGLELLF